MTKVQMLGDMKDAPQIEVMDTRSAAFTALVAKARGDKGADFSVCDVAAPARLVR